MTPTVIFQGKCRYDNSKNRKGYHDLERSIIQTQSVFWFTGNQEESILGIYSPHWDTSWCVSISSWGPDKCCLWLISWRGVHIILVIWSHVWESTCHQFLRKLNMIHNWCNHFCEVVFEILHFLLRILPVGFNLSLYDD